MLRLARATHIMASWRKCASVRHLSSLQRTLPLLSPADPTGATRPSRRGKRLKAADEDAKAASAEGGAATTAKRKRIAQKVADDATAVTRAETRGVNGGVNGSKGTLVAMKASEEPPILKPVLDARREEALQASHPEAQAAESTAIVDATAAAPVPAPKAPRARAKRKKQKPEEPKGTPAKKESDVAPPSSLTPQHVEHGNRASVSLKVAEQHQQQQQAVEAGVLKEEGKKPKRARSKRASSSSPPPAPSAPIAAEAQTEVASEPAAHKELAEAAKPKRATRRKKTAAPAVAAASEGNAPSPSSPPSSVTERSSQHRVAMAAVREAEGVRIVQAADAHAPASAPPPPPPPPPQPSPSIPPSVVASSSPPPPPSSSAPERQVGQDQGAMAAAREAEEAPVAQVAAAHVPSASSSSPQRPQSSQPSPSCSPSVAASSSSSSTSSWSSSVREQVSQDHGAMAAACEAQEVPVVQAAETHVPSASSSPQQPPPPPSSLPSSGASSSSSSSSLPSAPPEAGSQAHGAMEEAPVVHAAEAHTPSAASTLPPPPVSSSPPPPSSAPEQVSQGQDARLSTNGKLDEVAPVPLPAARVHVPSASSPPSEPPPSSSSASPPSPAMAPSAVPPSSPPPAMASSPMSPSSSPAPERRGGPCDGAMEEALVVHAADTHVPPPSSPPPAPRPLSPAPSMAEQMEGGQGALASAGQSDGAAAVEAAEASTSSSTGPPPSSSPASTVQSSSSSSSSPSRAAPPRPAAAEASGAASRTAAESSVSSDAASSTTTGEAQGAETDSMLSKTPSSSSSSSSSLSPPPSPSSSSTASSAAEPLRQRSSLPSPSPEASHTSPPQPASDAAPAAGEAGASEQLLSRETEALLKQVSEEHPWIEQLLDPRAAQMLRSRLAGAPQEVSKENQWAGVIDPEMEKLRSQRAGTVHEDGAAPTPPSARALQSPTPSSPSSPRTAATAEPLSTDTTVSATPPARSPHSPHPQAPPHTETQPVVGAAEGASEIKASTSATTLSSSSSTSPSSPPPSPPSSVPATTPPPSAHALCQHPLSPPPEPPAFTPSGLPEHLEQFPPAPSPPPPPPLQPHPPAAAEAEAAPPSTTTPTASPPPPLASGGGGTGVGVVEQAVIRGPEGASTAPLPIASTVNDGSVDAALTRADAAALATPSPPPPPSSSSSSPSSVTATRRQRRMRPPPSLAPTTGRQQQRQADSRPWTQARVASQPVAPSSLLSVTSSEAEAAAPAAQEDAGAPAAPSQLPSPSSTTSSSSTPPPPLLRRRSRPTTPPRAHHNQRAPRPRVSHPHPSPPPSIRSHTHTHTSPLEKTGATYSADVWKRLRCILSEMELRPPENEVWLGHRLGSAVMDKQTWHDCVQRFTDAFTDNPYTFLSHKQQEHVRRLLLSLDRDSFGRYHMRSRMWCANAMRALNSGGFKTAAEKPLMRPPPQMPAPFAHVAAIFEPLVVSYNRNQLSTLPQLAAKTDMRLPHEWYPFTRLVKRKIIYHAGPTNSGKTYTALQRLIAAEESKGGGIYVGPLRLLALEVYEQLNRAGVYTSLITGQEKAFVPFAYHTSATVECADVDRDYDVAVIDEIQMIGHPERGCAWTRALLGLRAKEMHLCGAAEAVDVVKRLCDITGDEFELREYERMTDLHVSDKALLDYGRAEPGDCIVAFNKADIYAIKREIEAKTQHKCCVIYGTLPPATRAAQARLFNEEGTGYDVLVASDAIGMGLNLNIRRIVFHSLLKTGDDAGTVELLSSGMVKQIAGRAGRRSSRYKQGDVTCHKAADIEALVAAMLEPVSPIQRAGLFPSDEALEDFYNALMDQQRLQLQQQAAASATATLQPGATPPDTRTVVRGTEVGERKDSLADVSRSVEGRGPSSAARPPFTQLTSQPSSSSPWLTKRPLSTTTTSNSTTTTTDTTTYTSVNNARSAGGIGGMSGRGVHPSMMPAGPHPRGSPPPPSPPPSRFNGPPVTSSSSSSPSSSPSSAASVSAAAASAPGVGGDVQLRDITLVELLDSFFLRAKVSDLYMMCRSRGVPQIATYIQQIEGLSIRERYLFASVPVNTRDKEAMMTLYKFAQSHAERRPMPIDVMIPDKPPKHWLDMNAACTKFQILDVYLWLANRFPSTFAQRELAQSQRQLLAELIQEGLQSSIGIEHSHEKRDARLRARYAEQLMRRRGMRREDLRLGGERAAGRQEGKQQEEKKTATDDRRGADERAETGAQSVIKPTMDYYKVATGAAFFSAASTWLWWLVQ